VVPPRPFQSSWFALVTLTVPLINYQALFDGVMAATNSHVLHWTVDGLHPASAGHHLMAEEILKTINFLYAAEEVIPEVTQRSTT
jgi:hypothetical protein